MKRKLTIQAGFTLVELMIATAVFGVMLLLIASGILQVGRNYYKGVTEARTQDTARSILDTISQDIQFGDPTVKLPSSYPINGNYALCFGANRYNIQLYQQLVGSSHVLTVDQVANCDPASPSVGSGRELMASNMRLQDLTVTNIAGTNLYTIHVRVIYGDTGLLCSPKTLGDCNLPTTGVINASDLTCRLNTGDQFCAFSDLTATVQKQIT